MTTEHEPSHDHGIDLTRLTDLARHPAVWVPAMLVGALGLFLMGRSIGASLYRATEGDTSLLLALGAGFAGLLLLLAAVIALDHHRQKARDGDTHDRTTEEGTDHVG